MAFRRSGAALPLLLVASVALAAPSDRERARAKLAEGSSAFDAGEYIQALRAFEDAYAILPSPKIHFNFGLTYAALGRYADALGAFERFVAEAPDAAPESASEARDQIAKLRRAVAYVEVTCDVAGAQVVVSGRAVGTTPLRAPFPVDPGPHDLVVKKDGSPPDVRDFTATAGARQSFRVSLLPPRPVAVAPAVAAPPAPWQTPAAWASGIGGGLLIGTGVVLEVLAARQISEFNSMENCGRSDPMAGGAECQRLLDSADLKRRLGIGALVAGTTAGVAAAALAVWASRTEARPESVACAPWGAGATCRLTF